MLPLLILGLCAFTLCALLTPLCRNLFLRLGLVDQPDHRKTHKNPVPRNGGVPIALAYAATLALVLHLAPGSGGVYMQHKALFRELLPAAALIFLTGLLDDIFGLRPWQKLSGQILAAILAVSSGARVEFLHLPVWASFVLSLVWLIGCTNAINLIDGMDGLAAGVALIATLTSTVVALLHGNMGLAVATIPLAGCLAAFLFFNFSPASVFLGDCGSLTIGFVLGCFSLIWSQHATTLLGLAAPLMALALPILDVLLAIARRSLRETRIFGADRRHIHHMILALGFSTRAATLILYAVCFLSGGLAILAVSVKALLGLPLLAIFLFLLLVGVDRLGYVEWSAARTMLTRFNAIQAVREEIYLEDVRRAVLAAASTDDCWSIVRDICRGLNFASAHLQFRGRTWSEDFVATPQSSATRFQVHIGAHDFLALTRISGEPTPRIMTPLLDSLQSALIATSVLLEAGQPSSTDTGSVTPRAA